MAGTALSDGALRALAKLIVDAETGDPETARAAVRKGLIDFGWTFVQFASATTRNNPEGHAQLIDLIHIVWGDWLRGDRISNKADEDERRARFALETMKLNPVLTRLAANAVFRLPEGHPLRDTAAIRESLL